MSPSGEQPEPEKDNPPIETVLLPFRNIGEQLSPERRARYLTDIVEMVDTVQKQLAQRGVNLECSLKHLTTVGKAFLAAKGLEPILELSERINSVEVKRMQEWAEAHRGASEAAVADAKARAVGALTATMTKCLTGRLTVRKERVLKLTIEAIEVLARAGSR